MTKKISKNRNNIMRERSIVLIDLLPFGTYTLALFIQLYGNPLLHPLHMFFEFQAIKVKTLFFYPIS
jgi:hypothetical protein